MQKYGHLGPIPTRGRSVVPRPAKTHDGQVNNALCCDLERFWPSRRGHAFDEFCR
jgi:hypothetical protein